MIDLNVLNKRGVTTDSLKNIFGGEDRDVPDDAMPLLDKIRDRVDDGLQWCIKNHKIYHALDLACCLLYTSPSPRD